MNFNISVDLSSVVKCVIVHIDPLLSHVVQNIFQHFKLIWVKKCNIVTKSYYSIRN